VGNTPQEFAALLKDDVEKWRALVKKLGLENLGG
jgi:hypothetical protein